jgi:amino acid transporter
VWCLQEALVTAELGSAFPEPSGSVAWVEEAFGPKAGLLCGYFHWVSGATDNAIYPALFLEYVTSYLQSIGGTTATAVFLTNEYWRFALCTIITAVLAFVNFTGLQVVGKLSIVVAVISMSPFVLMIILGLPQVEAARWFVKPTGGAVIELDDDVLGGETFLPTLTLAGVLWRPFINNLFWNMNSFDVGASFAGEVENSDRVFAKSMFLSILFVVAAYIFPLLVAVGASDTPQEDWKAGHLTVVAGEIAGPWLAGWIVLAAAVSNIALFMAELSGDAYQLMGMADRGLIPKVFCKRSRFDTPTNGILVGTFVICCLSVSDFDALVEMLNFAYSISLLMEFSAFVKLRITDDDLERPYRIPLGTVGCILFIIPSCCICLFLILVASKRTYIYVAILVLFGICFHFLQKAGKHYHWWTYVEAPKKKRKGSMNGATPNRV